MDKKRARYNYTGVEDLNLITEVERGVLEKIEHHQRPETQKAIGEMRTKMMLSQLGEQLDNIQKAKAMHNAT